MRPNSLWRIAAHAFELAFGLLVVLVAIIVPGKRRRFVWGPIPIINNKYWSAAVREAGFDSLCLVLNLYAINDRDDFDLVFDEAWSRKGPLRWLPSRVRGRLTCYLAFLYVARHARVFHFPYTGGMLGQTPCWRMEAWFYRFSGIKTVVIPYGSDAHLYSQIVNTSTRNALLIDYPLAARDEPRIRSKVEYWNRHADCVICGFLVYGMGRWDVAVPSPLCIDLRNIAAKKNYSGANGKNGVVRVAHSPNHRGCKGTEFIIDAVQRLNAEGLKVELLLLEKMPNREVLATLQTVDILLDQLIAGHYALSSIEGMASGLPVMCNMEDEPRITLYRRYGYLDECPILSATPENVFSQLKILVESPPLRRELGEAGRLYVEKYHSYEMAQYLFSAVYRKMLDGEKSDLMNLFHPIKSDYNRRRPRVVHPLVKNRLPQ